MMRGGKKSKQGSARQRGYLRSSEIRRGATTLPATDLASLWSRRGLLTLFVSFTVLFAVGVALAQIPTVPSAPPPPPGQPSVGQDSKIRVAVNLVVLHTTLIDDPVAFAAGLMH